jgi:hypothetical protein
VNAMIGYSIPSESHSWVCSGSLGKARLLPAERAVGR